jgi:hypothetical protein
VLAKTEIRDYSTCEVAKQCRETGSGGDGGKWADQGECETAKHVPDTGPGKRQVRWTAYDRSLNNALPF